MRSDTRFVLSILALLAYLPGIVGCDRQAPIKQPPAQQVGPVDVKVATTISKDVIAEFPADFPEPFTLVDAEATRKSSEWFKSRQLRKVRDENVPLREGVRIREHWYGKGSRLVAEEKGLYAYVSPSNIGYFLGKIETSAECAAVLSLFHDDPIENSLPGASVRRMIHAVETDGHGLPLKVMQEDINEELLSTGCFTIDGSWFVNFAVIEDTYLIEYKYSIDETNRIAVAKQVLIQGPGGRGSVVGEFHLPSFEGSRETEQERQHRETLSQCREFLIKAGGLEDR